MSRRGGGSIFQRGGAYWLKYYRGGQPIRESVAKTLGKAPGDVTEGEARKLLHQRLGKIAHGEPIALRSERVRVGELLDDLLTEYRVNGRRSIKRAGYSVAHLRRFFGDARAQTLDPSRVRVREYVAQRQATGASNATINREAAALKRAFTLGVQGRKILTRPHIPMLVEDNTRSGFFERDQLDAVLRHLPGAIRPAASFANITGWRRAEVLGLTWAQVDFAAGLVRLEPGTTKNRDGRMFPFTPELRALLEAQRAVTHKVQAETKQIIKHVFHRDGRPIKSFRGAWQAACEAAGVPGRIFHDFRRTAVRALERAGVPRSVSMKLTGHQTESVYRRYAIVAESDLRAAADKLAAASEASMGTVSGTVRRIGTR